MQTIDPDGAGAEPSFRAYCNQEDSGGGWMLVGTRSSTTTFQGADADLIHRSEDPAPAWPGLRFALGLGHVSLGPAFAVVCE